MATHLRADPLFEALFGAHSEAAVAEVLESASNITWHPIGGSENNFGIIENQQSSPVAALIEKITNSIDAILLRKSIEAGIDPKAPNAPGTMVEAIQRFFDPGFKTWHLTPARRSQAESIQLIASGSTKHPCLLIYDDGEGQHPDAFETTFLSLLRGNKNDIPFVQGKYNMGGTGAIVFCGKHRYHLIASRRFDKSGDFGYTLIRKHPMTEDEARTKKNTWYEFMRVGGRIARFCIDDLDLGLANRRFETGTVIKLYDYDLPAGTRGALPQEPRRAIDQFLFEPALPIYLVDTPERYPRNKVLQMDCFGLKHRLERDDNKYVETKFSVDETDHDIGRMKITCYVFRPKVEGRSVKETRDIIQTEFFHDSMAVLFSLNGQVHGHFRPEFITRTLKMPLLKNHLLVHVDCTGLTYGFRSELFMASRDRLKSGDDTAELRKRVATALQKSELAEIYKRRQNAISVEGGDAKDLLKSFSKDLPFNKDLMRLLSQAFKIDQHAPDKKEQAKPEKPKGVRTKEPFHPKRYPSFFALKSGGGEKFITIPAGDEKTIRFATDVEDNYFDRSDDPGDLKISILQHRRGGEVPGVTPEPVDHPDKLFDVRKSSPKEGTIRLGLSPAQDVSAGDEVEIQATLGGPEELEHRFWVKIVAPQEKREDVKKEEPDEEPPGLPGYDLVYREAPLDDADVKTWEKLGEIGIVMDFDVVMHPLLNGDGNLERIFINMDSRALRNHFSKQGSLSVESKELAEKRYISSVYFHTIFLFSITKSRKYELKQADREVDVGEYLKDVFSSYYADFLLNFGSEQLMASLAE